MSAAPCSHPSPSASSPPHLAGRDRSAGQALVEFTLLLPVALILLVAVADMGRVYATMITVESAAREAADFGAFNSDNWLEENQAGTLAAMEKRACVASSHLTDYEGDASGAECSNPELTVTLTEADGGEAKSPCGDPDRHAGPCRVRVDAEYTFELIMPIGMDFMGTYLGLPASLTFTRTSIFVNSDFALDEDA